jgi:hypothetical protein
MTFQSIIESAPEIVKVKLTANKFLRERPDYHPEESAFEHIKIVTERLTPTKDIDLVLAGILHDICKAETAKTNPATGWPTCPGHDAASFDLITQNESVQKWIEDVGGDSAIVAGICLNHMKFHQLGTMRQHKRDSYIQKWKSQGLWSYLQIFGAADNMLQEFDLANLEKSWKFNRQTA